MSWRCELTGKGPLVGHKVSHSNIKTKRRFMPNLVNVTLTSDTLGRSVRARISANALKSVDLDIERGEIFALLGPNGAGKTTMINIICGIVTPSSGEVLIDGKNWQSDYRHARSRIVLVPQELTTEAFESVWNTVSFSRGLFGRQRNDDYVEDILRRLSLWDKRKSEMRFLSGGMKRRAMIAKALSHEPAILFLGR